MFIDNMQMIILHYVCILQQYLNKHAKCYIYWSCIIGKKLLEIMADKIRF